MISNTSNSISLARYAWLSIAAAILTIGLKAAAYLITGSVGLLSDVLESFVNLAAALMALAMMSIAARPADEKHAYGHGKAEYFSSGVEGTLILVAALSIGTAAMQRLITPRQIEQVGLGVSVSIIASLINLFVARLLLKAGKQSQSITLTAHAKHLMADVWTSAGVVVGVILVSLTGWQRLDPVVAIIVAINIVWSGGRIVYQSISGLMDTSLPAQEQHIIQNVLESYTKTGVQFHAIRTRQSGRHRFVSLHVLVPGMWTVHDGHMLLGKIESSLREVMPNVTVFTHLESLDDPSSWKDTDL